MFTYKPRNAPPSIFLQTEMLDAVILVFLVAGVLGSGVAVLTLGNDPSVFWAPRNMSGLCPPQYVVALDAVMGQPMCMETCPVHTHSVMRHCLHPPAPSEGWGVRWWTLDDDLEPLPVLLPLALGAGFVTSILYTHALRWSSGALLFAAVYAFPVTFAWAALRATDGAAWAFSVIAAMLLLLAAVLTDSLLCASRITGRAAELSRGLLVGTAMPLITSSLAVCAGTGALFAAAALLASAVTVHAHSQSVLLRTVSVDDPQAVHIATGVVAIGAWCVMWCLHIGRLTAAQYMVPRVTGASKTPGACGALWAAFRDTGGVAATGSLTACVFVTVAAAMRYVTRHTNDLQVRGYRIARPLCSGFRALTAACAVTINIAIPVVYTTAVVYRVGFFPAARKLSALSGAQPVLFAVVQGSLQLVRAVQLAVCAAAGAAVSIVTRDDPPLTIAACAAMGALAPILTHAPLVTAAEAGMVAHGAGKARDTYNDLLLPHDVPSAPVPIQSKSSMA